MMYQRNMKHIISALLCFLFLVTIPASIYADSNSVHIEKINGVFHLWNDRVDFYVDEGGIQLTNHFEEYWTHNIWCLWVKIGETWHRKCADELSWNWENRSNADHSFVELNGTTTHEQGNYKFGFQVSYLLSENDTEIQIGLGVKNLGKAVDDLDFGWLTHKIQISGDVQNDVGFILLQNKTCQEILDCPSCANNTHICSPIPKSILLNASDIDYSFTEEDLWVRGCESCEGYGRYGYIIYDNRTTSHFKFDWCRCAKKNGILHNSTFHLFVKSIESEYNAPNLLRIHGSKLEKGDWVFTKFWFSDPDYSLYCTEQGCTCTYYTWPFEICAVTDNDCCECPSPLPNSHIVSDSCGDVDADCGPIAEECQPCTCDSGCSGMCGYDCDEGYEWDGSACVKECPEGYEDFTTYTEVDPNNDITVRSSRVTHSDVRRDESCYVYKDMGEGYFDGDFIHLITVYWDDYNPKGYSWHHNNWWALMNDVGAFYDAKGSNWLRVNFVRYSTSPYLRLYLAGEYNGIGDSDYYACSLDVLYYLTIARTGNDVTCEIYSDSERTNLLDTLSISLNGVSSFRYVYAFQSLNSTSSIDRTTDGYSQCLKLQEIPKEWHIVEIWDGQLITRQWREIENWYGNLTVRVWNEIETWYGKILSRSWKVNQALYGFLERYPPIPILVVAIFLCVGVSVVLFWRRSQ